MADYLIEIEHAASSLFSLAWKEHADLQKLLDDLAALSKSVKIGYSQAEFMANNAEDPDDVAAAAGRHWETYFGDDKTHFQKSLDRELLIKRIETHEFSRSSICGSLLQFAKQGISLAHGGLSTCPDGRSIGSQTLKTVIWEGRNHSLHWEDSKPHKKVEACFETLGKEINAKFLDYNKRNMAADVIELLGWKDWLLFKTDLLNLA